MSEQGTDSETPAEPVVKAWRPKWRIVKEAGVDIFHLTLDWGAEVPASVSATLWLDREEMQQLSDAIYEAKL